VRTNGIEMNVADQFFEIGTFLAYDGFVAVLEELTCPAMAAVKGNNVPGQEFAHQESDTQGTAPEEEMSMIWEKCPRVARSFRLRKERCEAINEIVSISVAAEDVPSLDPPDHYMAQNTRGIKPGLSGHVGWDTSKG